MSIEAGSLNPFITVKPHALHVGASRRDSSRLDALLAENDLPVVDTTGSQVAARVLQRRCREFGTNFVLASLTAGSYGGEVALFRPEGPCYCCFVLGQQDGSVPKPAEGPRSNTTPVGCSTPAFSGAGFDATALAALAARTAVRAGGKCGYPALDYDYVVVNSQRPRPVASRHPEPPPGVSAVLVTGVVWVDVRAQALIEHESCLRPRSETGGALRLRRRR